MKTLVLESAFNKFACSQTRNFIKKTLQHRCCPVKKQNRKPPVARLIFFFFKMKSAFSKMQRKHSKFLQSFVALGELPTLPENIGRKWNYFFVLIYSHPKIKNVNDIRQLTLLKYSKDHHNSFIDCPIIPQFKKIYFI